MNSEATEATAPENSNQGAKALPKWQIEGRAACRGEIWPELEKVHGLPLEKACALYRWVIKHGTAEEEAYLGRLDRYFLLLHVLNRADMLAHGEKGNRWLYERVREVEREPDGCLDLWSREHYKDLADDTPILTHNRGWTTHGDLRVGDQVYAPSGEPVSVVALSRRYADSECYRLTFSDGASLVAGAGHLWRVRRKINRRVQNGRAVEWVEDIAPTVGLPARADVGAIEQPVAGTPQQLPVDPYVLGTWLGDGHKGGSRITAGLSDADEMEGLLRSRGVEVTRTAHSSCVSLRVGNGVCYRRGSSDFINGLRSLGVLHEKSIPEVYKRASVHQRMMLLRGLMDTDGHCNTRGTATFVNVNDRLAADVYELAAGLAMRPRLRRYEARSGGAYWQVSFQAHRDRNPFMMERKAVRAIAPSAHRRCRDVASVERVPSVPTRCIQVVGGMYLAGRDLVPTHNSTVITFGGAMQEILRDPEITIGIFSHTRPIAKGFLRQVKREFEGNDGLKRLYPEVCWQDPRGESPKWSEDDGIVIKRRSNPKEATVEAHGLVDGQPTSKHYRLRIYDDVVTRESVTTPEMIRKVTEARELSDNLGSKGGREWNIGTRYHFADTYAVYLDRGVFKPRIYPATINGKLDGAPVFLTEAEWEDKKKKQPSQIAAQMLQNPLAGEDVMFRAAWMRKFWVRPRTLYVYILVDPSKGSPSRRSDRTGMAVIGIDAAHNKYLLDGYRHRMDLAGRWKALKGLHKVWSKAPGVQAVFVGYERYGLQSDTEHFDTMMRLEDYHFPIEEVAWARDHAQSKEDRVERLVPDLRDGRFWLPAIVHRDGRDCTWGYDAEKDAIVYRPLVARPKVQRDMEASLEGYRNIRPIKRVNEAREIYDVTCDFIEEALFFPAGAHDDLIDACARIYDMSLATPSIVDPEYADPPTFLDT